jgi:hypothetical protein
MIDKGKPHEVHPAYWAPFVVVGEGGPGSTLKLDPDGKAQDDICREEIF